MRDVGIITIVLLLVFGNGCKNSIEEKRPIWWDGKIITAEEFQGKTMAAMVWIRPVLNQEQNFPAKYQIYKRFDDNDYKLFLKYLKNPEIPSMVRGVNWDDFLYLSFLDGTNYLIGFDISHETIVLPNGYSTKLYSLFTEKKVNPAYDPNSDSGLYTYPGIRASSPEHRYRDDWIDPNLIQNTGQ